MCFAALKDLVPSACDSTWVVYCYQAMQRREHIHFELCAETLDACMAAVAGGADRIELCASLEVDGLTPELSLVEAAVRQSPIPVHVLLRPLADECRSSSAVVAAIAASVQEAKLAGAAGVVLGLLHEDGTVDVEGTRGLVVLAAPLPVTFHRAFDRTPDLSQALEDVIRTGCSRVLTSGGAADVVAGAPTLAKLIRQAGERIDVAIGGGLRLRNAADVARVTAGRHFHGSLQGDDDAMGRADPTPERVRQMIDLLCSATGCEGMRKFILD